jgi:hypothetical protein
MFLLITEGTKTTPLRARELRPHVMPTPNTTPRDVSGRTIGGLIGGAHNSAVAS